MPEVAQRVSGDEIRSLTLDAQGGLGSPNAGEVAAGRPLVDVSWEVSPDGGNVAVGRTLGVLSPDGGFMAAGAPEAMVFPATVGTPEWTAEGYARSLAGFGTDVRVRQVGDLNGRIIDLTPVEYNDLPDRPVIAAPDADGTYPTVPQVDPDRVRWTTGPDEDFPEDVVSATAIVGQYIDGSFNETKINVTGSFGRYSWSIDAANPEYQGRYPSDFGGAFDWPDPTQAAPWAESGYAASMEQAQADALAAVNRMPVTTTIPPVDMDHTADGMARLHADVRRREPRFDPKRGTQGRKWDTTPADYTIADPATGTVIAEVAHHDIGEFNDLAPDTRISEEDRKLAAATSLGAVTVLVPAGMDGPVDVAPVMAPTPNVFIDEKVDTYEVMPPEGGGLADMTTVPVWKFYTSKTDGIAVRYDGHGDITDPTRYDLLDDMSRRPIAATDPAHRGVVSTISPVNRRKLIIFPIRPRTGSRSAYSGSYPDSTPLGTVILSREGGNLYSGQTDKDGNHLHLVVPADLAGDDAAIARWAAEQIGDPTLAYQRVDRPSGVNEALLDTPAPNGVVLIRGMMAQPFFDARSPRDAIRGATGGTKYTGSGRFGNMTASQFDDASKALILTPEAAARWKAAYDGVIADMADAKARRDEQNTARKAARAARQQSLPDSNDLVDMPPAERLAKSTGDSAWLVSGDNYLSRVGVEKGQAVRVRRIGGDPVIDVLDTDGPRTQPVKLDRFTDAAPANAPKVDVPEARGNAAVAVKANAAKAVAARVQAAGDNGAPVEVADSYLARYGAPKGSVITVAYHDDRNAVLNVDGRKVKAGWSRFTQRIPQPTDDGGWDLTDPPEFNDLPPERPDGDPVVAETLRQIGPMTVMAISGMRREPIVNTNGDTIGVRLPVAYGYRVDIVLDPSDTYTVTRVFSRGGKDIPKGTMSGIYADQISDIAYLASNYNDPFGTAEFNDLPGGQLNLLDLAPDEMRAITTATPVFADHGWYPTDAVGGFRSPDGHVTVRRGTNNGWTATDDREGLFLTAGTSATTDPEKIVEWANIRTESLAATPVDTLKALPDDRLATYAADPNITIRPVSDMLDGSRRGRYGIIAQSGDRKVHEVIGQWRTPQEASGAFDDLRRRVAALAADPDAPDKLDAGAAKAPTFAHPANVKANAVHPGDWVTSIQGADVIAGGAQVAASVTESDGQVRMILNEPAGGGTVKPVEVLVPPVAAVAIHRPVVVPTADRPTYTESVSPVALTAMSPAQNEAVAAAAQRVAAEAPIGTERHAEAVRVTESAMTAALPESVDGKSVTNTSIALDPTGAPPRPGTAAIPPGAARLYHWSPDSSIEYVLDTGIDRPEGGATRWAQSRPPVGDVIPYVEFWATPDMIGAGDPAARDGHVALSAPVPATNIVSYSTPTLAALRTFRSSPALWTPERLRATLGHYPPGSAEGAAVRARLAELGVDLTAPAAEFNDFRPFDVVRSAMTRTPDREFLIALASTGVPNGDGRVPSAAEIEAMSPSELASLDRQFSTWLSRHPYGDLSGSDALNMVDMAPDTTDPAEMAVAASILSKVFDRRFPLDEVIDRPWPVTAAMDLSDDRLGELLVAYGSSVTNIVDGDQILDGPTIDDVGVQHPGEPVPDLIREVLRLRDVADHYGADRDVVARTVLGRCPECGADWRLTELVGEANEGGGYRVRCDDCGHEWDDPKASHADRVPDAVTAAFITRAEVLKAYHDEYGDEDPNVVMARIIEEQEAIALLSEVEDRPLPVVAAVLTGPQHDQRVAASRAAADRRRQRSLSKAQARHASSASGNKVDMSLPGSTTEEGNSYPHRPAGVPAPDAPGPDPATKTFFDRLNQALDSNEDVRDVPLDQITELADGMQKGGFKLTDLGNGSVKLTDPHNPARSVTFRRKANT